jgi:hypothetical protein
MDAQGRETATQWSASGPEALQDQSSPRRWTAVTAPEKRVQRMVNARRVK